MAWRFLSHRIDETTPLYGDQGHVVIERSRSVRGETCACTSKLALPGHVGTHIDAPRHFDASGACLEDYPADFWRCSSPWLIDCRAEPGAIIGLDDIGDALEAMPPGVDLLLLRTGFEAWRDKDANVYATQGPGVAPEVARWLRRCGQIRIFGIDFISVSSFTNRELGRQTHREFLCADGSGLAPVLLLEDMALSGLAAAPKEVWVVPLRFAEADGAPATVLAAVDTDG